MDQRACGVMRRSGKRRGWMGSVATGTFARAAIHSGWST
jgi:hypothetical protein